MQANATPEPECCYCQRVLWGSPVYLGAGKYRHEDCRPGSSEWAGWYAALPASMKSSAGDILYENRGAKKDSEIGVL